MTAVVLVMCDGCVAERTGLGHGVLVVQRDLVADCSDLLHEQTNSFIFGDDVLLDKALDGSSSDQATILALGDAAGASRWKGSGVEERGDIALDAVLAIGMRAVHREAIEHLLVASTHQRAFSHLLLDLGGGDTRPFLSNLID